MKRRIYFWTIFSLIAGGTLVLGFGVVPNWPHYFQTPEQRISYLYQSIWCPI